MGAKGKEGEGRGEGKRARRGVDVGRRPTAVNWTQVHFIEPSLRFRPPRPYSDVGLPSRCALPPQSGPGSRMTSFGTNSKPRRSLQRCEQQRSMQAAVVLRCTLSLVSSLVQCMDNVQLTTKDVFCAHTDRVFAIGRQRVLAEDWDANEVNIMT